MCVGVCVAIQNVCVSAMRVCICVLVGGNVQGVHCSVAWWEQIVLSRVRSEFKLGNLVSLNWSWLS